MSLCKFPVLLRTANVCACVTGWEYLPMIGTPCVPRQVNGLNTSQYAALVLLPQNATHTHTETQTQTQTQDKHTTHTYTHARTYTYMYVIHTYTHIVDAGRETARSAQR